MRRTVTAGIGLALLLGGVLAGYALGTRGGADASSGPAPPAPAPGQVWTCSMHPQVRLAEPGKCPICEMPLVAASVAPPAPAPGQVWTCSMHPQVRLAEPGKCPICEMPLVAASAAAPAAADGPPVLQLSEHARAMASVETVAVERRTLERELRAVGKIEFAESSLATITPRIDGYAEKLFVTFTGGEIRAGDHLVEIYSPQLLVAQQELLIAIDGGTAGTAVDSAKTKLRLLGLTPEQVDEIAATRKFTERVTLLSPITGTVIEKLVVEKAAIRAGEPLYRIANLDSVWAYLDVYEYDLPWVRYGQKVTLTAEALPGREFAGVLTFVQPVVTEATRTIRVLIVVPNPAHDLKPGMFVSAVVRATLGADGQAAPTGAEGRFTCRMHPQVLQDGAGSCPVCAMPLEQIAGTPAEAGAAAALAVPVAAVLDSGTRRLVYVDRGEGTFEAREVVLGPRAGGFHLVLRGLAEGERVVARGGFLIDSQFQITGHPSLLYPGGLHASMGHRHGEGGEQQKKPSDPKPPEQPDHTGHKR